MSEPHALSSKGKNKARVSSIAVQRPSPAESPPIATINNRSRGASAWLRKEDKLNAIRFQHYLDYAPKITLPVTLRMLQKPLTKVDQKKMEETTEKLLAPSHPARCTSAQYLDRNGNPLLFYFGRRLVDSTKNVYVAAKDQYKGQSVEEIEKMAIDKSVKLVRDGLHEFKCYNYQLAVQSLSADCKLHLLFDDTRHEGKNEMDYSAPRTQSASVAFDSDMSISEGSDAEDSVDILLNEYEGAKNADAVDTIMEQDNNFNQDDISDHTPIEAFKDGEESNADDAPDNNIEYVDDDDEINMEAYDTINVDNNGLQMTEQAGIIHLVHGWKQRGHPERGLFISGDISSTSTSLAAAGSHYALTESVAQTVRLAFKAVFPKWYKIYEEAFEAGVWFADDPGPFLGRAIVYKLQSRLHRDRHDVGPSVSFPVGQFTGGEMVFPQLNTKLQYSPGDFCIFFSSVIYHKVAPFTPLPQTVDQAAKNITPGRIGSVFFFPKYSLEILKGKPPRWGYKTAFGQNEHLFKRLKEGDDKS